MKATALKFAVCLLTAWLPFAAQATEAPSATSQPLKVGIIGTGDIGGALARHWAKAGHQLLISSRHPNNCARSRRSWART
jgi:lactate dehydrogenase-like 2-hydroxyacid dehydrogenase